MKTIIELLKVLYNSPKSWVAVICLLLQGFIFSLSTLAIIQLARQAGLDGTHCLYYFYLFILLFFLSYLPGILALVYFKQARLFAEQKYIQCFTESNHDHVLFLHDKDFKDTNQPIITKEASLVIQEIGELAYCFLFTFSNFLFNSFILGFFLNINFFLSYIIGFLLLIMVFQITKNKIQTLGKGMQQDRLKVTKTLLSSWENILIGNQYNLGNWQRVFDYNWNRFIKSLTKYEAFVYAASILALFFSLLPLWIIINHLMLQNINNWVILSPLITILPRQIQISQNFFIIFYLIMQCRGSIAKLEKLVLALTKPPMSPSDLYSYISWGKIFVNYKNDTTAIYSFNDLLNLFLSNVGRFTLQGENGTGKSTIMLLLKNVLGKDAFYLPCTSELCFTNSYEKNLSTGEKILSHLADIQQHVEAKYLLFDEWDANLDHENTLMISKKIDTIAKSRKILEIRHIRK